MSVRAAYLHNQKGFTYLIALLAVMLIGIMLGAAGTSWKNVMQREREEELLFRGMQIQDAIGRWHQPQGNVQQHAATPLNDLKDLLRDPRTPATVRYLRKLYCDPITNQDWVLIREPARGIIGVASSSTERVIKKDNFPDQLQDLVNKERYDQWQFVYKPTQKTVQQAVQVSR